MSLSTKLQIVKYMVSYLGGPQTVTYYAARALRLPAITLQIRGVKSRLICRPTDSDRSAMQHIFVDRDCEVSLPVEPQLIIDGGANVGYASVFFANTYPNAKILAVEPDSANCEIARKNCAPYPNVRIVQGGLWNTPAALEIENMGAESWELRVREVDSSTPGAMQGYTVMDLLKESGFNYVDLLKLDIEGAEEVLFAGPDLDWLDYIRAIVVEIHTPEGHQLITQELKKRNFTCSQRGEKMIFLNPNL